SSYDAYQLRVASAADITETLIVEDPITDDIIPTGVLNIVEALAAPAGDEISVIGQLVYRYGNYDSMNSAILQDVINGEIVAIQLYNSLDSYAIGDIVVVTGTKSVYGGVPQVQSLTNIELVVEAAYTALIPAQRFATITEMLAAKDDLLSEWVVLSDITLGDYNDNGTTTVTDATGATIGIYRAATYPVGVLAGEVVDLYACLSAYNTTSQLRVGSSTDYVVLVDNNPPVIELATSLPAEVGKDYQIVAAITDNVGVSHASFAWSVTYTGELTYNAVTGMWEGTVPGDAISVPQGVLEAEVVLIISASDVSLNSSEADFNVPVHNYPRIVSVRPTPNSATGDDKRPQIAAEFENAGASPTAQLYINGTLMNEAYISGDAVLYDPSEDMEDGKYTVKVVITRDDDASVERVWTFTVGEPQYSLYFGQLHSHTAEYSDGTGTLEDAYEYAMGLADSENVDFLAVTDHSNYFDTASNLGSMADASAGTLTSDGTQTLWQEAKATTAYYNSIATNQVFLYGFEMTWSGQYGHMNIYNTVGFESRNNPLYVVQGGPGLTAFYTRLKQFPDALGMFNHPGTTFGTFEDFAHWDPAIDEIVTMIEVGNGEGQVGSSSYWPSYEYYTLALDKGWHLAPTNNQDNHRGNWGNSNTARCVILTDNFTEEGIYQAMRDMAMYATEDHNLEIMYTLNNNQLGSIIEEPEQVQIYASISDPDASDAIGLVSVVVNGGVTVYSEVFDGNSGVLDITLPCDYSYYFIRVEQPDGDIAVTAPVWTGEVSKVGITSVTKDTVMEVKDEPTTITTNLYNYEATDLAITGVVYSLRVGQGDFEILNSYENVLVLESMSEGSTEYVFTPTVIGAQTLNVTVYGNLDGVPYVFTHNLELDVLDPTEIINVAIDAGHANFYISGNYAGSDAAFIELCAMNGIRVSYITEDITLEQLEGNVLLVLTVPYNGWENVGEENLYTQSELDAIDEYAQSGGNIIVCSKSDRGNPSAEEQMAHNITNGILEALGATSRIANGIVVDEVERANEAYRLYFIDEYNYNYSSPFLTDVLETTNNSFSCYNGAPIILGSGATEIIQGYTTTWGANYTADFGGSSSYIPDYETDTVVVPRDEVTVMASEELSGGGWLLISGVTFFSTFEVAVEVDNSTTLQNSNYQIVMNIIDLITPEPTITPIANVHAANEGVRFTVEGIVTSNASGFDQETAFFDCIYIQDETAGINLFPVDGNFQIGQKVRVTGTTSSYNGERQLAVSSITLVEDALSPVEPTVVTAAEAMSHDYTGTLLEVNGVVASLAYSTDGTLETIMVEDETGTARVFIDGYIMSTYTGLDDIQVGDLVSAIGLGSVTVDPSSGSFIPRMRVRNRAEIVYETPVSMQTVTVSHNGFGTTTPAAGGYEVEHGSLFEITFTPYADCTLTSVLVNGEEAIEYVTDGV
ncbi:MAG: CehA/McbA family metallohydrolase, partial [Clostridia bacterium]|nr:CehA/McbA family metallohydrolase [Clostridia bacterium]